MASRIIGCGGYLPKKILTNDDLTKFFDTNDEWIRTRTGIKQRHIAAEDELTSHMAYEASKTAILDAGITTDSIDLLVVCTTTPDNSFPSTASKLHAYLGLQNVPSFDLQAVCSGFLYGIHITDILVKSKKYKTVLLVCAEKMSSLLDWNDRSTSILFGDGAGAVILQYDESDNGILDSEIYSDGSMYDILYTNGGISSTKTCGTIQMKGQEVFKKAVEKMSESVQNIINKNNISIDEIDYFIPHQANIRIINNIASKLGVPMSKVVTTIGAHANCSAASIPLAIYDLTSSKLIKKDDLILITAFGAGGTWGASIIKW